MFNYNKKATIVNVQDKVETQRPLFKTYKEKSTKTQHTLKYPLRPKSKKSNLVLQMVNTLNFWLIIS